MSETETSLAMLLDHDPGLRGHRLVIHQSWDSVAFDFGDTWIFKVPRNDKAALALRREAGLLDFLRGRLPVPTPEMTLHDGGRLFSRHAKLQGETLPPEVYATLNAAQRDRLAADLARFYAALHALPVADAERAGALPVPEVGTPQADAALDALPRSMIPKARAALRDYATLGPDPSGQVYGFFDGHGWNLAFDRVEGRLNGIFDFADSGIGPLHQEFVTPSFISPDLTLRIVRFYEAMTARRLSQHRIAVLTTVLRLSELGQALSDPRHLDAMKSNAAAWLDHLDG